MRFAIRDDDINFFTKPEEIEGNYSCVWETCPISLSVTPFQAGLPEWLFPDQAPDRFNEFPLDSNRELVAFLKEGCARGRLAVMLHGYNHNLSSGEPEFLAGVDLARKAREGKKYLEELLETEVRCFVPPHNAISAMGIEAVVDAGMDIVGIQSFRPGKRMLHAAHIVPFLKRNWFLRVLREEYPRPLWVLDHWEIPYCTLSPVTRLADFRASLVRAFSRGGTFCLATHYWEFGQQMTEAPDLSLADSFLELWNLVQATPGVAYTSVGHLAVPRGVPSAHPQRGPHV